MKTEKITFKKATAGKPSRPLHPAPCTLRNTAGFTLIELIMVIVILGVLGTMGVDFISKSFQGFKETSDRTDIYEEGKMALFRMEREIHNSLPNAVNVSATDIEFGMIDEVAMRQVFGTYTQTGTAQIQDPIAGLPLRGDGTNPIISIYNLDWANDFNNGAASKLYEVINPANNPMNLDKSVIQSSPKNRYYAVDKVIRYQFAGGQLTRATAPISSSGPGVYNPGFPLAKNVSSLNFAYTPASLTRNALVVVNFTISRGSEAVNFHKEIHIRNVP